MAVAIIEATITRPSGGPPGPFTGVSSDDIWVNDTVACHSASTGTTPSTTYAWSIAYQPDGSTASFSGDVTTDHPGDFLVTHGGPYLVRLVLDAGLPTENEQFIRLRVKVTLDSESLLLVAAGEQYGGAATPIPVDIDPIGWTNEQNNNLLALLELIKPSYAAGNVVYVDANGGGDYSTIQAAINYAVGEGPTAVAPWIVLVRPATYDESLIFRPHVHVYGWPGSDRMWSPSNGNLVRIRNTNASGSVLATTASTQRISIANLHFLQQHTDTFPALNVQGAGGLSAYRCLFDVQGVAAVQGPGLLSEGGGFTELIECSLRLNTAAGNGRASVIANSSLVTLDQCLVQGPSGAILSGANSVLTLRDTQMVLSGDFGVQIEEVGQADLFYTQIEGATESIVVNDAGTGGGDPATVTARWSRLDAGVRFRTLNITSNTTFTLGSTEHGAITFPDGAPTFFAATTPSDSILYDPNLAPTAPDITATNVQDALDQIFTYASQVRTLDDAYDGGLGAGGVGRTITADAGAVQITDAPAPSLIPPPNNPQGKLQVVGAVEIGGVDKPEIDLDPNAFGVGADISLGWQIWPDQALYGSTAFLRGSSIGDPHWRNYNLYLGTSPSDGGGLGVAQGRIGKVVVAGGQGLERGKVAAPHAGDVYVLGGDTSEPVEVTDGGSIFLGPGGSITGTPGSIFLGRPESATAATLTAFQAATDPLTVNGEFTFGTEAGGITVTFVGGDTLGAVLGKFNSTGRVVATEAAGVITLTTTSKGPITDLFWISSDGGSGAGIDLELGRFSTESAVGGAWVDHMEIRVTDHNEITFGPLPGPAIGPMIYNADTGKLTVPGLIDPTGIVFDDAPIPPTGGAKGAIFVADGLNPLAPIRNNPYYVDENQIVTDLLGGGPGGLPVPDDEGQILYAATSAAFIKATPVVDADGYLLTNSDGHMVVT